MLNSFYDNGARLNSLTPTFIIEPKKLLELCNMQGSSNFLISIFSFQQPRHILPACSIGQHATEYSFSS